MDYEQGLQILQSSLSAAALDEFRVHEAQLRENLQRERLYGSTAETRAERAGIVDQLNRLAQHHLGVSFNELCQPGAAPAQGQPAAAGQPLLERAAEVGQRLLGALAGEPASPEGARGTVPRRAPSRPAPGPIRNRWALLVGVNRYVDPAFPPLRFCVNDVLALKEALQALGYTAVALYDDLPEERLLPTRENVEGELARLCQVAGPDDLLWVHLACHGKLVEGRPVLVTREVRESTLARKALPLADVEQEMRGSQAHRLVLTLDACHTGVEIGRDLADPAFIHNAHELAEGFALIAASTAQQVAQEWQEEQHGVFTYFLLEGLSGRADRAEKGFVTVDDLKDHVLDGLRRWNVEHGGRLQEPTARTEGVGDMILADHREERPGPTTQSGRETEREVPVRAPTLAPVLNVRMENGGQPLNLLGGQWWIRLQISSLVPIRECRGQLRAVRRLRGRQDYQGDSMEFPESILSWGGNRGGLFAPIDVQPGTEEHLDLVWRAHGNPPIPADELRVASALDQGPRDTQHPYWGRRQDFIPLKPGYYRIAVRIMAEGHAAPVELAYHLHWPGPGQEEDIRLTEA